MNAPMSRVLPTPVASAKQSDGKSRSKSSTAGYPALIAPRVECEIGFFIQIDPREQIGENMEKIDLSFARRHARRNIPEKTEITHGSALPIIPEREGSSSFV